MAFWNIWAVQWNPVGERSHGARAGKLVANSNFSHSVRPHICNVFSVGIIQFIFMSGYVHMCYIHTQSYIYTPIKTVNKNQQHMDRLEFRLPRHWLVNDGSIFCNYDIHHGNHFQLITFSNAQREGYAKKWAKVRGSDNIQWFCYTVFLAKDKLHFWILKITQKFQISVSTRTVHR